MTVPKTYWTDLAGREPSEVCSLAGCSLCASGAILVPFLDTRLVVDLKRRGIFRMLGNDLAERIDHPLLELITLVYLRNAASAPLRGEMIGVSQLKDARFFQGPHALKTAPLLERYGNDLDGFRRAARKRGGTPLDLADAAFRLPAFPKIPLYYLLWAGDAEFSPRLSVLFDRSIEAHFSADAVWGVVSLVSRALGENQDPLAG